MRPSGNPLRAGGYQSNAFSHADNAARGADEMPPELEKLNGLTEHAPDSAS